MIRAMNAAFVLPLVLVAAGCGKEDKSGASGASSASAAASASIAAAPVDAGPPAPPPDRTDCPKGSSGPGTFDKPCAAHGGARLMDAVWTKKIGDKGPFFQITNKDPNVTILYGKVAIYFYDKAGKQLEVKGSDGKTKPFAACAGANQFGGVMKPGEKEVMTFSCARKEDVPDKMATIEAEVPVAGIADASGTKNEFYWKNEDLTPDARKKGGVK